MPTHARTPHVTAVVVAHQGDHEGARWLPDVLAAVAAQHRPPDVVVAAEVTDGDPVPHLRDAMTGACVASCPPRTGFGDAVRAALALAPAGSTPDAPHASHAPHAWVWLLHDDCVPAPDALAALLAAVTADPAIAVAGPKLRGLPDRDRLREVGVTISRGGRRETGLERGEYDQGQHDGLRDVLGVSTAGMLVRRDVWEALGGLDPALPLLRDDVDLGWRARLAGQRVVCVTDAVAFHAESTTRGHGPAAGAVGRRWQCADRAHALHVLLANLPLAALAVAVPRLVVASVLRAVGFLLAKSPRRALDELVALASALGRPWRLVAARHARRRTRTVPARTALRFLAPRALAPRHVVEAVAAATGRLGSARRAEATGRGGATEAGPVAEEAEDLPTWGADVLRRVARRPGVWLLLALLVLTLGAARALLGFGGGRLMGGALLPAPGQASTLWDHHLGSWHPVGLGGTAIAPPYLAVLASLGTLLGSVEAAVSLLLIGAVPMAGVSAYLAVRRLVASPPLRLWAAGTYALLPPLLGAVAAGRLGTVVVAVLLPPAGLAAARAVGRAGGPADPSARTRAAGLAVLLLAVMTAFVPMTVVVVAALAIAVLPATRGSDLARLALLVVGPPALLLPWLPALLDDPGLLLRESGLAGPGLSDPDLTPLAVALLHPGGPGLPPLVVTAGLLLAALAGLLRPDRRAVVLGGWLVGLVGLAVAVLLARAQLTGATLETPVAAWPGPALLVAAAGLLVSATVGAEDAASRVARRSFGWRQPAAALVAGAAALGPVATAGWWLATGAHGPVERADPVLLPAFVAAEGETPDRPRTLVLRERPDGSLGYALLRADGPRLGHAELSTSGPGDRRLAEMVADLTSGRGGDAAARLLPFGVRFVMLTRPADPVLARRVDAVPGVLRVSGPSGAVLWRLDHPAGRMRLLPPGAPVSDRDGAPPPARVLPAGQVGASATVPDGPPGRLLALADPADPRWRATLDGRALEPTRYAGWAQAFVLPEGGGELEVRYDGRTRSLLLWGQLVLVLAMVVVALPSARRQAETVEVPR